MVEVEGRVEGREGRSDDSEGTANKPVLTKDFLPLPLRSRYWGREGHRYLSRHQTVDERTAVELTAGLFGW